MAPAEIDPLDRRLLNLLQRRFPLLPQPFQALAEELGIGEGEALSRTCRLKEQGVIRQISGIFDSRRLGYTSTLVAMEVPPESIDEGARRISAHPGVSHNYQRDHPFNLWFTLTLPAQADLEAEVAALARAAGARRTRILPALRLFKIGVELDLERGLNVAPGGGSPQAQPPPRPLTEEERRYVRVLQQDLPLEPRPFLTWARSLGVGEEELLARARSFIAEGIMRRFAALLHHRRAGFVANGMVCWRIPQERVEEVGRRLASCPEVSHCYQRPTFPDWPYNIFAMIHARSRQQCEEIARRLAEAIGSSDYVILYSIKEYKKERPAFFTEALDSLPPG